MLSLRRSPTSLRTSRIGSEEAPSEAPGIINLRLRLIFVSPCQRGVTPVTTREGVPSCCRAFQTSHRTDHEGLEPLDLRNQLLELQSARLSSRQAELGP